MGLPPACSPSRRPWHCFQSYRDPRPANRAIIAALMESRGPGALSDLVGGSIVAALKARSSRLDVVGSPAESCSQCLALPSPAGAALPPDHATEGRSGDGVGRRPCPHRTGSAGGAWAAPRFIATAASKIIVKDDLDKQCRRTRRVGSATRPASHRDRGDTPLQTQCKEVTPPFHFSQISP